MVVPPRRFRHLTIFSICLGLLLLALAIFLFAVNIEHTASGTGVVTSEIHQEWLAPTAGTVQLIPNGFRSFEVGTIRAAGPLLELTSPNRPGLIFQPPSRFEAPFWMISESRIRDGETVTSLQSLLTVVPVSDELGNLHCPLIRAEFDEKQFGSIRPGQKVRVKSLIYSPRTYGYAEGAVATLRPVARESPTGSRKFQVEIGIVRSPFPLLLGSSVEVEVILGRKETFRVILEH
jgi:hypothetical protein